MKYKRKAEFETPILRGFLSKTGKMIEVFCPYCDRYHLHGWDPESPSWAITHRVAHCNSVFVGGIYVDGPLMRIGYYIGIMKAPKSKGAQIFPSTKRKAQPL